jgi:hypothetical protein
MNGLVQRRHLVKATPHRRTFMATVQWRPEVNALTTPQYYTVRYLR